ncbi:MAG: hypothetical protein DHS20C15_34000 [Planctomycetota bacterium]|nr:MAG: hypothetical protein DHS20C15_34000 [Planctomycetota bacterium]
MTGTLRVFRAEWYRIVHGRSAYVALAFLIVVPVVRVVAAYFDHLSRHGSAVMRAHETGRDAPELLPGNAYQPLVDAWATGLVLGALLLLVAAALSIAGDRERGVLRLATTRSATRRALVLGRALLGFPLVLCVIAITGIAAFAASAILFEFGPLVEFGFEMASSAELSGELQLAVLATLPPLYAAWCFGLLMSSLVRGPIFAVSASLLLLLGFDLFKGVLGEGQYWVFAAFAPSFIDSSYMGEMSSIAAGMSDAMFADELFRMNMILPWPEAALLLAFACTALSRRTL